MNQPIEIFLEKDFDELLLVWKASVEATHYFIKKEDLLSYKKPIREEYFYHVKLFGLRIAGKIAGFAGVADHQLEMLFIHPDFFGQGFGRQLVDEAVHHYAVTHVDVNEANTAALNFYQKVGFTPQGRSAVDGQGKAYPLIHLGRP